MTLTRPAARARLAGLLGVAGALVRAMKDAGGEVDAYAAALGDFVDQALRGDMDKADLARAHRELIREYAPEVYTAAAEDAGVDPEDLDEEDDAAIDAWVAEQLGYVGDFAAAVIAARGDKDAAASARARVDTWAQALRALASTATMNAKKNLSVIWRVGDTEHCETCQELDGQKHRLAWFQERDYVPQKPGAGMDCGGYRCQCVLEDTKGKQVLP